MLKRHIILRLETDTSTENVGQGTSLFSKGIDHWSTWWGQWRLEHVAEDAKNAMEVLEIFGGDAIIGWSLPLDSGHHLGNQDKINDQRRGKEGVLADVEESAYMLVAS